MRRNRLLKRSGFNFKMLRGYTATNIGLYQRSTTVRMRRQQRAAAWPQAWT